MGNNDVAIFHEAESCCSDGCDACQDITEAFRLDTNFLISQVLSTLPSVVDLTFFTPAFDSDLAQVKITSVIYSFKAPPEALTEISPQALLQTFRC